VGLIVGIDRFMSEARALTNFAGNAVATVLIGSWVGELDNGRARRVAVGEDRHHGEQVLDDETERRTAAASAGVSRGAATGGDGRPNTDD
jgi:aerobic C4-dicarboxylate transport protein